MDYDSLRRYSHGGSFGYSSCYFPVDRNSPLAVSHATRPDPRGCPVGVRTRPNNGREEPSTGPEPSQTRRRIAVACARCRKRKIRCSGDPGNGTGCQNCKSAGADLNQCQFHRVGSDTAAEILAKYNYNSVTGSGGIPLYPGSNPVYSRPIPGQFSNMAAKPSYPSSWAVDDGSFVGESHVLDQSYLSAQMPLYGGAFQKTFSPPGGTFLDPETPLTSSCATPGLSYMATTGTRPPGAAEPTSPLSMSSLQSTLPVSFPERHGPKTTSDSAVQQRQLPYPQPTRGQVATNAVDAMQTRALPSAHIASGPTGLYTSISDSVGGELNVSSGTKGYSGSDSILGYGTVTSPSSPESSGPHLSFSASSILESMPAASAGTTYSNFRNYTLPTSSSTETMSLLSRGESHGSLYSFTSDSVLKRGSNGEMAGEPTLVSGHPYAPLGPPPNQSGNLLSRDSFEARNIPSQTTSMSTLNRGF